MTGRRYDYDEQQLQVKSVDTFHASLTSWSGLIVIVIISVFEVIVVHIFFVVRISLT